MSRSLARDEWIARTSDEQIVSNVTACKLALTTRAHDFLEANDGPNFLRAARALSLHFPPIQRVADVSERIEDLSDVPDAVIDNRTSELTSWNTDLLPDELAGLDDLDVFSFDDVLPLAATAGKTDPDDIPETPKNPVSRVGDIWTLGKHRLMCGDATHPEHVERLLDGSEPDLMVTDPPYGVNYDASWRDGLGYAAGRARGASTNDDRCD